jgi:hypothetical protein
MTDPVNLMRRANAPGLAAARNRHPAAIRHPGAGEADAGPAQPAPGSGKVPGKRERWTCATCGQEWPTAKDLTAAVLRHVERYDHVRIELVLR